MNDKFAPLMFMVGVIFWLTLVGQLYLKLLVISEMRNSWSGEVKFEIGLVAVIKAVYMIIIFATWNAWAVLQNNCNAVGLKCFSGHFCKICHNLYPVD